MDHSIYGYLSRRETALLMQVLEEYRQKEPTDLTTEVIESIEDILLKRKDGNSEVK